MNCSEAASRPAYGAALFVVEHRRRRHAAPVDLFLHQGVGTSPGRWRDSISRWSRSPARCVLGQADDADAGRDIGALLRRRHRIRGRLSCPHQLRRRRRHAFAELLPGAAKPELAQLHRPAAPHPRGGAINAHHGGGQSSTIWRRTTSPAQTPTPPQSRPYVFAKTGPGIASAKVSRRQPPAPRDCLGTASPADPWPG